MPLSKYDREYGGKRGAARKAMSSMREQYGAEKGKQVFYATKNKRKKHDRRQHLIQAFMHKQRHGR